MGERCHICWNLDGPDTCTCGKPDPGVSDGLLARRYLDAIQTGIGHSTWSEWLRRVGLRRHHDPSFYVRTPLHHDVIEEAYRAIAQEDRP